MEQIYTGNETNQNDLNDFDKNFEGGAYESKRS